MKNIIFIIFLFIFSYIPSLSQANQAKISRLITIGPNITEIVFALKKGYLIKGIDTFSHYPKLTKDIPKIGGIISPNTEYILSINPDCIIIQGKNILLEKLCKLEGIKYISTNIDSLESLYSGIYKIGKILDSQNTAYNLVGKIKSELTDIRVQASKFKKIKTFFCIGHSPDSLNNIYSIGSKSFISELIGIAGGDNIYSNVSLPYPEISKESLLKKNPQVILDALPGSQFSANALKTITNSWKRLGFVHQPSIHILTEDYILIPGPRVARIAQLIFKKLHPNQDQ